MVCHGTFICRLHDEGKVVFLAVGGTVLSRNVCKTDNVASPYLTELNLGDRCLDGVLNNNNYESDILKVPGLGQGQVEASPALLQLL